MGVRLISAVTVLGFWVVPVSAAQAQNGLHVDPSSPGGKEYAIPLDQARGDAAGGPAASTKPPSGGSDSGSDSSTGPLFGVGVKSSKGGSGHKQGSAGKPHRRDGAAPSTVAPAGTQLDRTAAAAPAAGGDSVLWFLGPALGIVLVGGLFGLLLRRRSVRHGPLTASRS